MTSYPDQRALSEARMFLEGWGIPVIGEYSPLAGFRGFQNGMVW